MEKQTKQTLKVLSTLALASSFALITTNTAEAKSYKPEVRYDGKDYFVKTSDPEAIGKTLHFSTDGSNTPIKETQVTILYDFFNYKGEELNISKQYKMGELGKSFTPDTPFSIVDDDHGLYLSSDDEATDEETRKKKGENFVKSAKAGFTTVNELSKVEKTTQPAQPTGPAQPVQPAGPEQPVQPAEPEQPAKPTGTEQPAKPTGTEQPAKPTGTEQPAQPTGPVQPAGPKQPVQPAGPEQPAQPAGPAQPVQPAQPKKSELSEIVGAGEAQNNPKNKELFGHLETTSNKDDKKVESTIKSEGKVNTKKALPNTGLQTSSYALLGSIIGLVGIMALRRKNSN